MANFIRTALSYVGLLCGAYAVAIIIDGLAGKLPHRTFSEWGALILILVGLAVGGGVFCAGVLWLRDIWDRWSKARRDAR